MLGVKKQSAPEVPPPRFNVGVIRLRTVNSAMQAYLQASPEALMFFDHEGELLYQNNQGERQCERWNRGMPKGQWRSCLPFALKLEIENGRVERGPVQLLHPELHGLTATILQSGKGWLAGHVLRFTDDRTMSSARELSASALFVLKQLSPSEQRVARLVAQGLRTEEVAERLCRSPRTVEYHLNAIFRKLDVRNRVMLARMLT